MKLTGIYDAALASTKIATVCQPNYFVIRQPIEQNLSGPYVPICTFVTDHKHNLVASVISSMFEES